MALVLLRCGTGLPWIRLGCSDEGLERSIHLTELRNGGRIYCRGGSYRGRAARRQTRRMASGRYGRRSVECLGRTHRRGPGGDRGRHSWLRLSGRRASVSNRAQCGAGVQIAEQRSGCDHRPAVRIIAAVHSIRGASGNVRHAGHGHRRRRGKHDACPDGLERRVIHQKRHWHRTHQPAHSGPLWRSWVQPVHWRANDG